MAARHGDHGRVVGRELEFGQERPPAALPPFGYDAVAQARVGRNAPGDGDVADAGLLRSLDELVQQNRDDGVLQRGAEVGLALLDEVGIFGHTVAQRVEERGLEPREGVVEPLDAGPGETERLRIAFLGQPVDDRTSGIGEPHHFGTFIEGFACGVVDRGADDLHLQRRVHAYDLRVASADQQRQEREIGVGQPAVGQVDEVGEDVPLQVVDFDQRDVAGDGESLGEGDAHEQRSHQTRAAREGDGVDLRRRDARFAERRVDHRHDVLLVRIPSTASMWSCVPTSPTSPSARRPATARCSNTCAGAPGNTCPC